MIIKKDMKPIFLYTSFIIFLSTIFFIEISRGAVVFIFSVILFLCTIYYILKRKIPVFTIIFIIFLGIFIHSIKYEIRDSIWHKNNLNSIDKIYITKNIIFQNFSFNRFKNKDYSAVNNHRLFHSINSLNIVSKLTPEKISFYKGGSYKDIYSKFIPRFIWKKKPLDEQGNFWGHRYLVLNPEDKSTSWNFPVLNEFYANFGMIGVFFGMFFLGFLIKLLILKLWKKNISDIEILISSIILFNFFFLENNLSQILGKVINQLLFFHIFFIFIYLLFFFIFKFRKKVIL
jgi:oligosaccharide repeat unit polymerase